MTPEQQESLARHKLALKSNEADALVATALVGGRAVDNRANSAGGDSVSYLRSLFDDCRRAVGFIDRTPPGFDMPTRTIGKVPAIGGMLNLNGQSLPSLFDKDGELIRTPSATLAATTAKISTGILNASRVAAAGANVIVRPDPARVIPTGKTGIVALQRNAAAFRTLSAATFATVVDDAEVTVSAFPALAAEIDWSESINRAVRFKFTRAQQHALERDFLYAEIIAAVTMGIARAADATLLAAITAATPAAFTLTSAAAQGLKFGELRSLVGTAGNGATVAQDGALRVAGITAELTADMAGTIVGAFDRSAIAVHEEVSLHLERLNTAGDLEVTAFVDMIPLVPDAAKFWTVGA